ncbi:MAG: hypothetical protein C4529_01200 [Deltaproteobacteria bacterium]|nr:MAG: hypothetical protein C4529_01200 [Deltaproteobacteria bacterium]
MAEPVCPSGAAKGPWWLLSAERANRLALVLLFLITIPMLTKIFTSDFGTHLALGKFVVQKHEVPSREHWNYPSLGMENGSGGEWGFQAVLYLVHSAGGEYAVSIFIWAVVIGIFLFLHRAIVLRGAHPLVAVLAIFAFSGFLRIRIQPRPEIFTYLFISMTIFLLSEYYFGSRRKLIYLFPPMILVWANSHPTYLMAFALYGAFFVDALARAAWKRELQWPRLRGWIVPPLVTGIAGLALCGLNPHGYGWLMAPLHMISRGSGTGAGSILISISELTPVKGTGFFVYYKAALAFAAVSLALGAIGRRIYLLDLFLFVIAFKGAWDSARAVSMMGLFLSPGASLHLTGFLTVAADWFAPKPAGKPKERQKGKKTPRGMPAPLPPPPEGKDKVSDIAPGWVAVTAAIMIAVAGFGGTTLAFSFSQLEFGLGITEHKFSFKAAEFLRKYPIPGKMFNFFDIGGFLDWQLYPDSLTFIDGRTYNQDVFRDHQLVTGGIQGWQMIIRKHGISHFILKTMDSSGSILPIVPILAGDPDWALVFSDGLFVVFVRRYPELEGYVRAHEIPKGILPSHIIQEAYHYTYLGISPVVAYHTIANMYLAMGDRSGAIRSLQRALNEAEDPYLRNRLMQLEQGQGGPAR